jgi:sarcosine oxidase
MDRHYTHIVVGAGALGSAAAYRLARTGTGEVLVLEQFELGNSRGASEDHSRIIRHSYHSPTYTALTQAAYDTWAEIEAETGLQVVLKTGGLDLVVAGTPQVQELENYRRSLAPVGIASEDVDAVEIRKRWPQWQIDDDVFGMYQQDAGILDVRRATAAHIALARGLGVEFSPHTTVRRVTSDDQRVTVETNRETFTADAVVLCVASWLPELLPGLGVNWDITLSQEQVSYFVPPNLRDFSPDRFPIWAWHGESLYYGFPVYGEVAVKASRDMAGRFVSLEERSYSPNADETEVIAQFLRKRLPGAVGPELVSKTCVYDMPPDRDFILDRVPGHSRVTVGLGAGHAAKFASLLGIVLADLATKGTTAYPVEAFRADRPALTDPDFVPAFRLAG